MLGYRAEAFLAGTAVHICSRHQAVFQAFFAARLTSNVVLIALFPVWLTESFRIAEDFIRADPWNPWLDFGPHEQSLFRRQGRA